MRIVRAPGVVLLAVLAGCNSGGGMSTAETVRANAILNGTWPGPSTGVSQSPGGSSALSAGRNAPGTTPGTVATTRGTATGGTATPGVTTPATPAAPTAASIRADALRAIVATYVASGDEATALTALNGQSATPGELLALLRGPRKLNGPLVGGHQQLQVADDNGTTTDLQIEAPPVSEMQTRAAKGLGLVVLLHGLGGNAGNTVGLGTQIAATNDVVAIAPSAQLLPAGFLPEDGMPASLAQQFPKWWIYESNHTFALQAIRVACANYPIDPERVVLCGASMGGYGTWNIGLRHPDRFAAIAPMCGGLTRLGQAGMHDPRSTALLQNGLMFPLWGAHGDADTVVPYGPDKEAADALTTLGGDVTFKTLPGVGHNIASAILGNGTLAAGLTDFVTTKRRKSLPLSVNYLSAGATLDGAHWLRIATRTAGVSQATITGSIDKATNTISLSGSGVDLARVYVDDRILDITKPITITVGGAVRYQAMVTPSLSSVLQSWLSREDEGLVYSAYVELPPV